MEKNDKLKQIKELLKDYDENAVNEYVNYIYKIHIDTNSKGELTSPWASRTSAKKYADYFKIVNREGLYFDGIHITLNNRGIQYDYIAYKNKMLLAYPETKIDIQLVYEGDDFQVAKESGNIIYHHTIASPFQRSIDKIIGGYCVIINKRGEFITLLSKEEFNNHRQIAKTKYIWDQWYGEMAFKTLFKKAIKIHFSDIYENIEKEDNKNYDLENLNEVDSGETKIREKIGKDLVKIKTVEELKKYYNDFKGTSENTAIFMELVAQKQSELNSTKTDENI